MRAYRIVPAKILLMLIYFKSKIIIIHMSSSRIYEKARANKIKNSIYASTNIYHTFVSITNITLTQYPREGEREKSIFKITTETPSEYDFLQQRIKRGKMLEKHLVIFAVTVCVCQCVSAHIKFNSAKFTSCQIPLKIPFILFVFVFV